MHKTKAFQNFAFQEIANLGKFQPIIDAEWSLMPVMKIHDRTALVSLLYGTL